MKISNNVCLWMMIGLVLAARVGLAEEEVHSDVEFGYVGEQIDVKLSSEGILVFEGEFPQEGLECQFTTEPGFASEVEEGLGIGPNETVVYNVLSGLLFWDGLNLVPAAVGTHLRVNHLVPQVPDTIIVGNGPDQLGVISNVAAETRNLLGISDAIGGDLHQDLHQDLRWFLEPNCLMNSVPATGAYGVVLSLSTSAEGIANSQPFAMMFNFGLSEGSFEAGVDEVASLVPEPTSVCVWVFWGIVGLMSCRTTGSSTGRLPR